MDTPVVIGFGCWTALCKIRMQPVTTAWPILPPWPTSTSQNLTEFDALTVTPYCLSNLHFNDIRPLTWGTVPMQIAEGPLTYTPRQ